ncbi:MAG: TonB-dependent receptor [Deltaproteobacteria bacterium]|jgi:vitamin B12 transporter|nr:TonB-dependent receptor [Deltaproteobacteria bacterium]
MKKISFFFTLLKYQIIIFTIFSTLSWAQSDQEATTRQSSLLTLDTVVISSSRTMEEVREITSNITVLGQEEIKYSSANNLGDLLAQEGFHVAGYNGGVRLTVRGMAQQDEVNSRVLILLNGRRVITNSMDLTAMANVERVEIIRGPASLQYGPAAMGGVINVITKRGEPGFKASAEVGFGSYNLDKEKASFSGQSGAFDFSVGFTHTGQDDIKTGLGWKLDYTSPGDVYNTNLNFGYTFNEKHRFGFDLYYLYINDQTCPPYDVSYFNPKPVYPSSPTDYNSHDREISNYSFSYDGRSENNLLSWSFTYGTGKNIDHIFRNGHFNTYYSVDTFTGFISYKGDSLEITSGLDFVKYLSTARNGRRYTMSDLGGFATGKIFFMDRDLIFSFGGRYDGYSLKDLHLGDQQRQTNFVPSIGVAYLPRPWLKFRANYAEGFGMPLPTYISGNETYLPSPDLKPEKSETFELGLDISLDYLSASLTYFHTVWDNKFYTMDTGINNPNATNRNWYKYFNLEGAEIAGLELSLTTDLGLILNKNFSLKPYVNATYMTSRKNKDHSKSSQSVESLGFDTLRDVPRLVLAYGITFSEPNWNLLSAIKVRHMFDMVSPTWASDAPPNPYINYSNGPIVDFMAEKRIFDWAEKGHLNLRLELNNVFDRYDLAYLGYPKPGRNFYLGVSYEY